MNELSGALKDLDEKKVNELVEKEIAGGASALDIINACNEGMVAVGELFSKGDYFISQLIFSAEILKGVMARLEPLLEGSVAEGAKGKVVIAQLRATFMTLART